MVQSTSATNFVNSIGINTSITLIGSAYQNYAQMMNALSYVGVTNVRDTYDNPYATAEFSQMGAQLNLKFDFFIAVGSASPEWQVDQIKTNPSIVSYVEGYNESDGNWQTYNGVSGVAATQAVQQFIYGAVKSDPTLNGVGVIQATFVNPASFVAYGDMSAYADYASTHTYWGTGNNPIGSEASIVAQSQTISPGRPTITTESGYHTTLGNVHGVSQLVQAKYELDLLFEQAQAGVKLTYLWELADNYADPGNTNSEDHFGIFNNDWTPKLAAIALHNTMQIMADPGTGSVVPGALNYSLGSLPTSVQTALYQKSDGTFVLVVWNDVRLSGPTVQGDITVAPIATTLQLGQQFAHISIFDPLTGTSSIQDFSNASSITLQIVDHPIMIELSQNPAFQVPHAIIAAPDQIITNPLQAVQVDGLSVASGSGTVTVQLQSAASGLSVLDTTGHLLANQSNAITLTGSLATINAELATVTYTGGSALGGDVITITTNDQSGISSTKNVKVVVEAGTTAIDTGGPAVSMPASFSSAAGATSMLPRFSVADTYAATHSGTVTLTVHASSGVLQVALGSGQVSGNVSSSLSLSGSFSQVVAALGALSYTAPGQATQDTITVGVTDQAGYSSTGATTVSISPSVLQPVINTITGNNDGGVTLKGKSASNSIVAISDNIGGTTTVLGTATTTASGTWSFTSHAKVNMTTINSFGVSASDSLGNFGTMIGRLNLGSTQPDTLTGTAGTTDVFAIMSFHGADVISGFQSTLAFGATHDVIDFSGRGIASFGQVQAMTSGTSSAIITIGGGKSITLSDVPPSALSATDFRFS